MFSSFKIYNRFKTTRTAKFMFSSFKICIELKTTRIALCYVFIPQKLHKAKNYNNKNLNLHQSRLKVFFKFV